MAAAGGLAQVEENPRDRLDQLRAEVDSLGTVLDSLSSGEESLRAELATLDQKYAARERLIAELDRQLRGARQELRRQDGRISARERDIDEIEGQIEETEATVDELQDQVSRRWVHLYKKGGERTLAFLLTSSSPLDLLRRQVYVQRIHKMDEGMLNALRQAHTDHEESLQRQESVLTELRGERQRKAATVQHVEMLVAEATTERQRLQADRARLAALRNELQADRELVQQDLEALQAAMAEIESWILRQEERRITGTVQEWRASAPSPRVVVRDVPSFATFAQGRGRLPWPVTGRVVGRFGMVTNAATGTVTENPGVDILAGDGAEVLAVQAGTCTRITYVRGFGTTLLLSHGNGYYTVYAHLASIWVTEGEPVPAGRVLGTVGSSEDSDDPRLHFQIWHEQNKQDPLAWLSS